MNDLPFKLQGVNTQLFWHHLDEYKGYSNNAYKGPYGTYQCFLSWQKIAKFCLLQLGGK